MPWRGGQCDTCQSDGNTQVNIPWEIEAGMTYTGVMDSHRHTCLGVETSLTHARVMGLHRHTCPGCGGWDDTYWSDGLTQAHMPPPRGLAGMVEPKIQSVV